MLNFSFQKKYSINVSRCVSWINRFTSDFDISDPSKAMSREAIKSLSELALVLSIIGRNKAQCRKTSALTRTVWALVDQAEWQQVAAYDPTSVSLLGNVGHLSRLTGKEPPFEPDQFQMVRRMRSDDRFLQTPHRQMDLAYSSNWAGDLTIGDDLRRHLQQSVFGRGTPPVCYSLNDVYALTHAVFYLTDLGAVPAPDTLSADERARLHRELIQLTVVFLRGDNLDILGELLMCWLMTGVAATPAHKRIFAAGLQRIAVSQADDGAVPPKLGVRADGMTDATVFSVFYHTTLVVLALGCLLRKNREWV